VPDDALAGFVIARVTGIISDIDDHNRGQSFTGNIHPYNQDALARERTVEERSSRSMVSTKERTIDSIDSLKAEMTRRNNRTEERDQAR